MSAFVFRTLDPARRRMPELQIIRPLPLKVPA